MAWVDLEDPLSVGGDILRNAPSPKPTTADAGLARVDAAVAGRPRASGPMLPLDLTPAAPPTDFQRREMAYDPLAEAQRTAATGIVPTGYRPTPAPYIGFPRYLAPRPPITIDIGAPSALPGELPGEIAPGGPSFLEGALQAAASPAALLSYGIGKIPTPFSIQTYNPLTDPSRYFTPGLWDLIHGRGTDVGIVPGVAAHIGEAKPVEDQNAVTQFVAQSIPYMVAPEAGMGVFLASLPEATRQNVEAYQRGEISRAQLAKNLTMTLGPLIAPELAKLGIRGAGAAIRYGRTPEGEATLRGALERAQSERGALTLGEPPPEPSGPLPGQVDMFTGEQVKPAEQPQMAVPEQRPGGEVPLAERQALSLESPAAKRGSLFETPAERKPPPSPEELAGKAPEAAPPAGEGIAARYVRARDEGLISPPADPQIDAHARYEAVLNDRALTAEEKAPILEKLAKEFEPPEATPPAATPPRPPAASPPAEVPAVSRPAEAAGAEPALRTVPIDTLKTRPDLFQGRDTSPGLPHNVKRVEELRGLLREGKQFGPIKVVADPANPGQYIVVSGHHRLGAYQAEGVKDVRVELQPGDINQPAVLQRYQGMARTENYKTAPTNFREKAGDFGFYEDQGESVDQIAARFSLTKKVSEVQDALDARRLGQGALDRVVEDKQGQAIAAELGRGMRVYGINAEDGNAMLRKFLEPDPGGKVPSRGAVKAAVDLVGQQMQSGKAVEFAGFAGMGGEGTGAMKLLNDFTRKQGELESEIRRVRSLQNQVKRFAESDPGAAGDAKKLLARAKRREATLSKDLAAAKRGFVQEVKGGATGPKPLRRDSSAEISRPLDISSSVKPRERTQERVGMSNTSTTARSGETAYTRPTTPSYSTGPITTEPGTNLGVETAAKTASPPTRVYQPKGLSAKQLDELAQEHAAGVDDAIRQVLADVPGAHLEGVPGANLGVDIKSAHGPARLDAKVAERGPAGVSDYLRTRVAVDSEDALNEALRAIERDFTVTHVDNFLDAPKAAYRAVHLQVEAPGAGGFTFELQLVPTEIARIQEGPALHQFHARWRNVDTSNLSGEQMAQLQGELTANQAIATEAFNRWPRETAGRSELLGMKDLELINTARHEGVAVVWKPSQTLGPDFEVLDRQATADAVLARRGTRPPPAQAEAGAAGQAPPVSEGAPPDVAPPAASTGQEPPPAAPPPRGPRGTTVPPSEQFPDLVTRYTTDQREIFDRINADAETQARVKGFGSVKRAIDAGETPGAKLIAKAKGATQRLLSPAYYVRNANVLTDETLGMQRLAHARRLAVGAQDAQAIAIRLADKGQEAGLFRSQAEWAKAYRGPAAAGKDQASIIGYLGDVVERPGMYDMPERTRAFLRANQKFLLSRLRYAKASGVDIKEFNADFITHAYKEPKGGGAPSGPTGGVGKKQATQKGRVFGSYWDAAKKGLLPEFTGDARGVFEALTQTHQGQLQKAIADAELIKGLTHSNVTRTAPARGWEQTSIRSPKLAGVYFKRDVAHAINETLGPQGRSMFERVALIPSDMAKTTMATLDASPLMGIQGVRRILDNPARGLADVGKATQLVVDDNAWRHWLTANEDAMRQAAADGTNLFQNWNVSTEGTGKSLIGHVPLIGKLETAANDRFYGRGVAMYKTLSYVENRAQIEWAMKQGGKVLGAKVRRQLAAGETPGQIAGQHVNNIYGGLERALRGQSQGYQAFERFFMFAPDFFRAQSGLLSMAAGKALTPQGAASLRFLLGALAVTAGVSELVTQATTQGEQHVNLTHPERGDWLMAKTPAGNVSIMGPLRTYLRTAYTTARDAKKGDLARVFSDFEFFGRTRLGPVPSNVMSQTTNRDVLGRPVRTASPNSLQDIGQRALFTAKGIAPFGVQQTAESVAKGGAMPAGIAAISALGFSVYPERIRTAVDEAAQAKFGRNYYDLSPGERAQMSNDPNVIRAQQEYDQENKALADAGDAVAVARQFEDAAAQKYSDSLAQIEDTPDGAKWRDAYNQARDDRLAALDTLRRTDAGPIKDWFARIDARDPSSPRLQVLHDYFAIYDQFKDPTTGRTDPNRAQQMSDALDAFQGKLTDQQAADLQQDLGAKDTPRQAQYRAAVRQIAASGYWDAQDQAVQEWSRRVGANFTSYAQFMSALSAEARKFNARPEDARAYADVQALVTQGHDYMRTNNPSLDAEIVRWYGGKPKTPAAASILSQSGLNVPVASR